MKKIVIHKLLATCLGMILLSTIPLSSAGQPSTSELKNPAYTKAIEMLVEKNKDRYTRTEIIELLTNPEQKDKTYSPAEGESFSITTVVAFAPFHGEDDGYLNYEISEGDSDNIIFDFEIAYLEGPEGWISNITDFNNDGILWFVVDVDNNADPESRVVQITVTAEFYQGEDVIATIEDWAYLLQEPAPSGEYLIVTPALQVHDFQAQSSVFQVFHNLNDWNVVSITVLWWIPDYVEDKESNTITFEVDENTSGTYRSADITILGDGEGAPTFTIEIIQGALTTPVILVSPETQVFDYTEQLSAPFNIIHFNIENWKIADSTNLPWGITVETSNHIDDYVVFNIPENQSGSYRVAQITIEDTYDSDFFDVLTIIQAAESQPFILVDPEIQSIDYEGGPSQQVNIIHYNIDDWADPQNLPPGVTFTSNHEEDCIIFDIPENTEGDEQVYTFTIQETGENPEVSDEIMIVQGAQAVPSILITPETQSYSYETVEETSPFTIVHFNIEGWEVIIPPPDDPDEEEWVSVKTEVEGGENETNFVTFNLDENTSDDIRTKTVRIQETGNETVFDELTIIQGAQSVKSILVTPEIQSYSYEAVEETSPFTIVHFNIDGWEVIIPPPDDPDEEEWVSVKTEVEGGENETNYVTFKLMENTSDDIRTKTVRIQEVGNEAVYDELTIIQGAQSVKSILVTPEIQSYSYEAVEETSPFTIVHFNIEGWEVIIPPPDDPDEEEWVSIKTEVEGGENETNYVTFKLLENTTDEIRDKTIRIQELGNEEVFDELTIYQGAESVKTLLVTPETQTFGYRATQSEKFNVVKFNIGSWSVEIPNEGEDEQWIELEEKEDGEDIPNYVIFEIYRNNTGNQRTETITLRSDDYPDIYDELTIIQGAESGPSIIVTPEFQSYAYEAVEETDEFYVIQYAIEDWEPFIPPADTNWISVKKKVTTTNPDYITFSLTQNTKEFTRQSEIMIVAENDPDINDTLTIIQGSLSTPSILAYPQIRSLSYTGSDSVKFDIIHFNIEDWEVGSDLPSWVEVQDSTHAGNDFITFKVQENTTFETRDTIVIIADVNDPDVADTLFILQDATPPPQVLVYPRVRFIPAAGDSTVAFYLTAINLNDDWQVEENTINDEGWIELLGNDQDSLLLEVSQNTTPDIRIDTIWVSEINNTVVRDSFLVYQYPAVVPVLIADRDSYYADWEGVERLYIDVFAENILGWTVSKPSWIKVNAAGGDVLDLTILKNDSVAPREALVILYDPTQPQEVADTIFFFQYGKSDAYFLVTPEQQYIPSSGGELFVPFIVNPVNISSWDYQIDSSWLHVTRSGDTLTGSVDPNNSNQSRTATIRVYDVSDASNYLEMTVQQGSPSDPDIVLNPTDYHGISPDGETLTVYVYSNIETYSINTKPGDNWAHPVTSTGHFNDTINIVIDTNSSYFQGRSTYISFDAATVSRRLTLTQASQPSFDIAVEGKVLDAKSESGVAGILVKVGPNEAITDDEGIFRGQVPISWQGNVTPQIESYYFSPANWTSSGPVIDPILADQDSIVFYAYEIKPDLTINGEKMDSVYLCEGDILMKDNSPNYPIFNYSGTYKSVFFKWEDLSGMNSFQQDNMADFNASFFPSQNTDYLLTIFNPVEQDTLTDQILMRVLIKDKPLAKTFSGPNTVCCGQAGTVYRVNDVDTLEHYGWELWSNGAKVDSSISGVWTINWKKIACNTTNTVSLRTMVDICVSDDSYDQMVTVSQNEAPAATIVRRVAGDNLLMCDDTTASRYEWGWMERLKNGSLGDEYIYTGCNDWYCRFDTTGHLDEDKYYYFVKTYTDDGECFTISFLDNNFPVSIAKHESESFKIFPNPAENTVNIRIFHPSAQDYKLELLDITGNQIYRKDIKNVFHGQQITLHELRRNNPGLYFLKISSSKLVIIQKLILR